MLGLTRALAGGALLGMWAASVPFAGAGELPGSDGKLDYGIEGLDIPAPQYRNATTPRTADLLEAAIGEQKVPFAKAQLVVELGSTRLAEAVPTVHAALSDPDAQVRAAGAFAFVTLADMQSQTAAARAAVLGDPTIAGRLSELLKDPDPQVSSAALHALVTIRGGDDEAMVAVISGGDGVLLATALELASGPKAGAAIAGRLASMSEQSRPGAIAALGRCKMVSALPQIHSAAASRDEATQVAACRAMREIASRESVPVARSLADSTRPTVVREAIRAYGVCADAPDRVTLAVVKLDHTDPTVRQAAVEVLGANLNPTVMAPLVAQLPTDYQPLYQATRAALISAKDAPTREACIAAGGKLLHDSNPRREEDGSYVLGRYRSAHELERHIQLLGHASANTDWTLVAQVVESLGLVGRQEARKPIVDIVTHGEQLVTHGSAATAAVDKAYIAAGQLGASEILPACGDVLAQSPLRADQFRRQAAVFAIGACGTPQSPQVSYIYTVLASPMEAKVEAIKAIGNLKLKDGVARLEAKFPMDDANDNHWLVEWAVARIKGEPVKHTASVYPWSARTSYRDISQ